MAMLATWTGARIPVSWYRLRYARSVWTVTTDGLFAERRVGRDSYDQDHTEMFAQGWNAGASDSGRMVSGEPGGAPGGAHAPESGS